MDINSSGTSIRLANGGFVDAIDASEQYYNQYFSKKDPEFNATSSTSARDLPIHDPTKFLRNVRAEDDGVYSAAQ